MGSQCHAINCWPWHDGARIPAWNVHKLDTMLHIQLQDNNQLQKQAYAQACNLDMAQEEQYTAQICLHMGRITY